MQGLRWAGTSEGDLTMLETGQNRNSGQKGKNLRPRYTSFQGAVPGQTTVPYNIAFSDSIQFATACGNIQSSRLWPNISSATLFGIKPFFDTKAPLM